METECPQLQVPRERKVPIRIAIARKRLGDLSREVNVNVRPFTLALRSRMKMRIPVLTIFSVCEL